MNRILRKLLFFSMRHALWVRLSAVILTLLSGWLIYRGAFTYDVSKILPTGSESARTFACLSESGMFNRIVVVFSLDKGEFADSALPAFLEKAAEEFRKTPGIHSVNYRTLSVPLSQGMAELTEFQTRRISPDALKKTDAELDALVRRIHSRLMLSGVGQTEFLRQDPFSLNLPLLQNLERFRRLSGLELQMQYPYLVSADGKHALMILRTSVPIANPYEGRRLISSIEKTLSGAPENVKSSLIASHLHSIANEEILKADILRLGVVSVAIFLVLFIVFYKSNARTLLIPLIPFLATVPALAAMTLVFQETLLFTVGMGGVIVGLGVDYGIHIFSAMTGKQPYRSLLRILPALAVAAMSSVAAFLAFMISHVEAFIQFGFFAAGTLLFTFALMIFLLPAVFAQNHKKTVFRFTRTDFPERHPGWTLLAGLVLFCALAVSMYGLRFNPDIRQFDAADGEFAEREALYNSAFQKGPRPGVLLLTGKTRAEAMTKAAGEAGLLRSKLSCDFFSPTDVLGTEESRRENLSAWLAFERDGGLARLQRRLETAGEKQGIDKEFFAPFFDGIRAGLRKPSGFIPALFTPIAEEMIHQGKNGFTVAVMIPDGDRVLTEKIHAASSAVMLSNTRTAEQMSADVTGGISRIGFFVCLLVFLMVLIFFRNLTKSVLALLPVAAALLAMGGIHALFWSDMNLSVLVAGIIVVGLSVDYGIIMTDISEQTGESIYNAVTFSAVTSVAGGMTVLFAKHLMLRSAGLTIVTGISAAWAAGVFLIPAIRSLRFRGKKLIVLFLVPLLLCLAGCRTEPFAYPAFEPVPADFKPMPRPEFKGVAEVSVVLEKWFYKITFLVLLRMDGAKGNVELYAASPGGGRVFEAAGTPEKLETFSWVPFLDEEYRKTVTEMVYDGLCRAYRNDILPRTGAIRMEKGRFIESFRLDNAAEMEYIYAGKVPSLIRKRFLEDGSCRWEVFYYRYEPYGGTLFPRDIVFEDHRLNYRLILRTRAVSRDGEKP